MSLAGDAAHLQDMLSNHCSSCGGDYSFPDMFAPFEDIPKKEDFDPLMDDLLLMMNNLSSGEVDGDPVTGSPVNANPALDDIGEVTGELTEWRGEAADTFRDNVDNPFPTVVKNLYIATAVLRGAVQAEQALWAAVNKDIEEIMSKAKSAADTTTEMCPGGTVNFLITVTGAVVAIAMVPATGGLSAAMVAGAFSVAGAATGVDWNVDCMHDVVKDCKKSIDDLKGYIKTEEGKIQTALRTIGSWLETDDEAYSLVDAPTLADAPGGITGLK